MRINFTGRKKIDKQHARVTFPDDPVGSKRGHYFNFVLELESYKLPPEARVFLEATRGLTLMRFDLGTVGHPADLTPSQRRLTDFAPEPDGVKLRVKVTQPDGPDAGKLLAEADGITPEDGTSPLIYIAGSDALGQTPWRIELVPTDSDLPTLYIHTTLGGKGYAKDLYGKPLLMTAAAREVFAALVEVGDHEDEPEHWAALWGRFATQVLKLADPADGESWSEEEKRDWVEQAVNAFAEKERLVQQIGDHKAALELLDLEEIN